MFRLSSVARVLLVRGLVVALGLVARVAAAADQDHGPKTPPTAGDEDRDADGVSNRAEQRMRTDPDVPGLFPGSYPHIPEPLHFDLVRGLGARRGEFEVNTLITAGFLPFHGIGWAPEVEWAFADRYAVEFEVPMHDGEVKAIKVAVQGTFREQRPKFIHGGQLIGEGLLEGAGEVTALYIAGRRFGRRTSGLVMIGPRTHFDHQRAVAALIVNPSVFVDIDERFTIGIENNGVVDGSESLLRSLAQLHLQLGQHLRVQVGAGVEATPSGARPAVGLRVIVE